MSKGAQIKIMLLAGNSNSAIRRRLSVSTATVSYHSRKLGLEKVARPSYDWKSVQPDVDAGASVRDLCAKYGFSKGAYCKAVRRGAIIPRPLMKNLDFPDLVQTLNGKRSSPYARIIMRKLLAEECGWLCAECGIHEWRGKSLTLEVDHIDGNPRNNERKNLRLLCPNCHSTTATWRGRNSRK